MVTSWAKPAGRKQRNGHWRHSPPWQRQMKPGAGLWNSRLARVDAGRPYNGVREVPSFFICSRGFSCLVGRAIRCERFGWVFRLERWFFCFCSFLIQRRFDQSTFEGG
jgi:hypothetical protein